MAEQEKTSKPLRQSAESGQALLEYALILILVVVALAAALIATGPALGNVDVPQGDRIEAAGVDGMAGMARRVHGHRAYGAAHAASSVELRAGFRWV